jgi:hypothetical protein
MSVNPVPTIRRNSINGWYNSRRTSPKGSTRKPLPPRFNESLRQQFVQSTIRATAEALAVAAAQMRNTTSEFARSASTLGDSYRGAAEEARQAVANFESTSSHAISSTKRAAEELVHVFREEYRWSLYALLSIALLVGIETGMLIEQRLSLLSHTVERTSVAPQAQCRWWPVAQARNVF